MPMSLVPLTTEEIQEIQTSVVEKMIELNKEMRQGKGDKQTATAISTLGKISEKISNYQRQY